MNALTTIFSVCCLSVAVIARPGIGHTGLQAIPDLQTYGEIKYPHNELIHLGEYSKGFLPGDSIHETKHITVKEPQPYPVKIPVPHPYPVHIEKPYPVVETKYVKVPIAVPYEITKNVHVPVEVPKPYPVHVDHDSHGEGSSYGQGYIGGDSSNFETQDHSN